MGVIADDGGIAWSAERYLPQFQRPQRLRVYTVSGLSRDGQLSVATFVGLINRPRPQVYLISRRHDAFWLQEALDDIHREDAPVRGEAILPDLLSIYRDRLRGMIIYDPALADSINVATTLAGQRDGIVVSPDQVRVLSRPPFTLPVLFDLREYGWRSRAQAYNWAMHNLLAGANAYLVAGLGPDTLVGLRPFLVASRTFIYWLDPRKPLPVRRAGWLSERGLMRRVLRSGAPGAAHLGWFIQEGSGVTMTSQEARLVFASDHFANLEVWASVRPDSPAAGLPEPEPPRQASGSGKVYLSFTFSEGDNLQYMQERMADLWHDEARGSLPIGWTISPLLVEAAPSLLAYYARTATPNDEFVAGPSGAGYMFPSWWPRAQLSPYLQQTGEQMRRMNLRMLQVLDSNILQNPRLTLLALRNGSGMALIHKTLQERFAGELATFGVRGLLSGSGQRAASWRSIAGALVYQNVGLLSNVEQAIAALRAAAGRRPRPFFLNAYVLAWTMTPTLLRQVVQELGEEYEVVTPAMLVALIESEAARPSS
jgi:GxGYxYP putative glycoside hydrolase C-terminal domain/GxGYxY sequence motif in domain of unknown function N-terminal